MKSLFIKSAMAVLLLAIFVGGATPGLGQGCSEVVTYSYSKNAPIGLAGYRGFVAGSDGHYNLYRTYEEKWTVTPGSGDKTETYTIRDGAEWNNLGTCLDTWRTDSTNITSTYNNTFTASNLGTFVSSSDTVDTQETQITQVVTSIYTGGTQIMTITYKVINKDSEDHLRALLHAKMTKARDATETFSRSDPESALESSSCPKISAGGKMAWFQFRAYLPKDEKKKVKWVKIFTPAGGGTPVESDGGIVEIVGLGELIEARSATQALTIPEKLGTCTMKIVGQKAVTDEDSDDSGGLKPGDTSVPMLGGGPSEGGCCGTSGIENQPAAVGFSMSLGRDVGGASSGDIQFSRASADWATTSPDYIRIATASPNVSELIPTSSGALRKQIRTKLAYFNIESANTNEMRIKVYKFAQMGTSLSGGVYPVNTGSPYVELSVVRPGTDPKRVTITQVSDCVTKVWDYTYEPTTEAWNLVMPGSTGEVESRPVYLTGGMEMRNRIGVSGSTEQFTKQQVKPQNGVWLPTRIERGSGGNTRVETREYNANFTAAGSFLPLNKRVSHDGSWEMFNHGSVSLPGGGSVPVPTKVVRGTGNETPSISLPNAPQSTMDYTELPSGGGLSDDDTVLPFVPRRTVDLLNGKEIRTSYTLFNSDRRIDIVASSPSADYWDTSNRRRTKIFYSSGNSIGYPKTIQHPDGLATHYEYTFGAWGKKSRKTVYHGVASSWSGDVPTISDGSKTEEDYGEYGQLNAKRSYRIQTVSSTKTTHLVDEVVYSNFDDFYRPQTITRTGRPAVQRTYGFCGLSTETAEDGTVTTFLYDAARRQIGYTRNGITISNVLNAAHNVLETWRLGTDASWTKLNSAVYNDAGEVTQQRNALNGLTLVSQAANSLGGVTYTTTYPDGGTKLNEHDTGGTLVRTYGSAVSGLKFEEGTETVSGLGTDLKFTKQTRLNPDGSATSEWTKTYYDHKGQAVRTTYADGSYEQTFYNADGQVEKTIDADGVVTLSIYNDLGELEYSGIDVNQNGVLEDGGLDRVTRTIRSVATAHGTSVLRMVTSVYQTDNSSTATDVSTVDTAFNGLHQWVTTPAGTSESITAYSGSQRTVTQISPLGTSAVSVYDYGRLTSVARKDTNSVTIGSTTYDYDAKGRTWKVTDARIGSTTYAYNAADQAISVTTPAPGNGQTSQTTSTDYNDSLQAWRVTQPDGTKVTNEFYMTGQLKKTYGSRTYPVEYTYDHAGRMKTMKTWQGFAANSGAAITTWNYDSSRGWLTSKRHDDNKGPDYTYTVGSRLKTRQWARTGTGGNRVTTTYKYGFDDTPSGNSHGDLTEVAYSNDPQSTPTITYTHDRRGRQSTVVNGDQTTAFAYNASGQPATETYSGSGHPLNNWAMGVIPDSFYRRGRHEYKLSGTVQIGRDYGYDSAGRLANIVPGPGWVTFDYLPNSSLIEKVNFFEGTISSSVPRMVTTRSYDKINRLLSQKSDFTGQSAPVYSTGYDYNDANQRVRKYEPDGSYWVYAYDNLGQVTSGKRYWVDGSPVAGQQFEYAFDDIGNRSSAKSGGDANGLNLRTTSYSVNLLNQYSSRNSPTSVDIIGAASPSATVTVNSGATVRKGEYFWKDLAVSNGSGPASTSVSIAASSGGSSTGKLLWPAASESPTYDDDGNLLSDSLWTYTWNGENRLVAMQSQGGVATDFRYRLEFIYDWMGRRIQKVSKTWDAMTSAYVTSGTKLKFLYDGWNILSELDGSNNQLRTYMWGPDLSGSLTGAGGVGGLLSMFDFATYKYQFYAYDGNGNVSALVNQDGTTTARYDYGPFGELVRSSGALAKANPFRFSTKYQDDESGLSYYGYRFYDPLNGRWPNRDPLGESGFEALKSGDSNLPGDGPNSYLFLHNNPIDQTDYLGLYGSSLQNGVATCMAMPSPAAKAKCLDDLFADGTFTQCAVLGAVVQALKIPADALGKCKSGDSPAVLKAKTSAWLALVIARNKLHKTCFCGGNPGHQQQVAQIYTILGDCISYTAASEIAK